jgi:hypothetical protein
VVRFIGVSILFSVLKEGGKLFLTQHCTDKGEYSEEYREKVSRQLLLPFWCGGIFYSDPKTMTKLLKVFGFEVDSVGLYADIHPNQTITRYLGLIASKKSVLRNAEGVRAYGSAANQLISMATQPLALPKQEIVKKRIVEKGHKSQIPHYETYLECVYTEDVTDFTQNKLFIYQQDGQKIGEILLQYYPSGGYYKTAGQIPTIRLRNIEIEEQYRKAHHGTRALETLFTQLRQSTVFPGNAEVWLEYSSCDQFLAPWYDSFGFCSTPESSFAETKVMRVLLSKTKFPYNKKMKDARDTKK